MSIDTMLLGRKTYEVFAAFWPIATSDKEIIADKLNAIPDKVVFTNTLQEAPWGKWSAARVVRGDAAQAIREMKSRPGKDRVIQVCPTLVGGGKPLFPALDGYQNLKLVD